MILEHENKIKELSLKIEELLKEQITIEYDVLEKENFALYSGTTYHEVLLNKKKEFLRKGDKKMCTQRSKALRVNAKLSYNRYKMYRITAIASEIAHLRKEISAERKELRKELGTNESLEKMMIFTAKELFGKEYEELTDDEKTAFERKTKKTYYAFVSLSAEEQEEVLKEIERQRNQRNG